MTAINTEILIVGAGLAGLMAARIIQEKGIDTILVDKGRSVGGRLATRRIGPGRADHGAQFFTVRSPEFQSYVDGWLTEGLVFPWSTGWSSGSIDSTPSDGYPRYAVRDGMNALAKHLAQGLETHVDVRLTSVTPTDTGWQAQTDSGQSYTSRALLMTPPVPQSLTLLADGGATLSNEDQTALAKIAYAPCVAALLWVDGPVDLPEPGALQRPDDPISWIADNQRKGISPDARLITVHAAPDYSRTLWDTPQAEALALLTESVQPFFTPTTTLIEAQLKRWRYALPTELHPDRTLVATDLPPLVFAGDAFGGPRVEGAALSGLTAGRILAKQ